MRTFYRMRNWLSFGRGAADNPMGFLGNLLRQLSYRFTRFLR